MPLYFCLCSNCQQHHTSDRKQQTHNNDPFTKLRRQRVVQNGVPESSTRDAQTEAQDHTNHVQRYIQM